MGSGPILPLATPMVIESTFMSLLQIQKELFMTILMTSSSRGGHIGFFLIEKGPCRPSTSGYADGHRVQMYVSITNTEGVIAMLMLS